MIAVTHFVSGTDLNDLLYSIDGNAIFISSTNMCRHWQHLILPLITLLCFLRLTLENVERVLPCAWGMQDPSIMTVNKITN